MGTIKKMEKIDWEEISQEESKYRLKIKREIAKRGIPRETIRNFTTNDLLSLY